MPDRSEIPLNAIHIPAIDGPLPIGFLWPGNSPRGRDVRVREYGEYTYLHIKKSEISEMSNSGDLLRYFIAQGGNCKTQLSRLK